MAKDSLRGLTSSTFLSPSGRGCLSGGGGLNRPQERSKHKNFFGHFFAK